MKREENGGGGVFLSVLGSFYGELRVGPEPLPVLYCEVIPIREVNRAKFTICPQTCSVYFKQDIWTVQPDLFGHTMFVEKPVFFLLWTQFWNDGETWTTVFDMILHISIWMTQSLHLSFRRRALYLADSMNTEQLLKNTTYFVSQEQRTISPTPPPIPTATIRCRFCIQQRVTLISQTLVWQSNELN